MRGEGGQTTPQRKARHFQVINLAQLRNARGLTLKALADMMIPPVRDSFVSRLEHSQNQASPATLMDLARIFGSIEIEDELGHRYTLIWRGRTPDPNRDALDLP